MWCVKGCVKTLTVISIWMAIISIVWSIRIVMMIISVTNSKIISFQYFMFSCSVQRVFFFQMLMLYIYAPISVCWWSLQVVSLFGPIFKRTNLSFFQCWSLLLVDGNNWCTRCNGRHIRLWQCSWNGHSTCNYSKQKNKYLSLDCAQQCIHHDHHQARINRAQQID